MRFLPIIFFFFLSCAGVSPGKPQSNDCGIRIVEGGNKAGLTPETLSNRLGAFLDAMTLTTEPRFLDVTEVCQRLVGYRVYTREENHWIDPWGRSIAGYTSCINKVIMVGSPALGDWRRSSLVHEMFHAAQLCSPEKPPVDEGTDEDHADWFRKGIFDAIQRTFP